MIGRVIGIDAVNDIQPGDDGCKAVGDTCLRVVSGAGWGLRTGGLGIVIGLVAIALAAAFLVIDFDNIQKGVQRGAPAKYAWAAAFGLAVTLVWMYLEFLRLLAILRGD